MPGMDDEDALLQGDERLREADLDAMAVKAARNRQKQKATVRKPTRNPKADTESDTDLPDRKRSKESGG